MAKPRTAQHSYLPWIAGFSVLAFFLAINFCSAEALIPHAHDDASLCCNTIQAIAASKLNVQLPPLTKWLLVSLDVKSLGTSLLVESAGLASGLSPPPRTAIPALPFYRTAYASLAPPAHLA